MMFEEAETMDGIIEGEEEEEDHEMVERNDDEGGFIGGKDNDIRLDPFVQPPILKALFELLSLEELAKCRLVCKLWCNESLSTWRSKCTLKFVNEGIVSIRKDGVVWSKRTTSVKEFLDLWDAGDWGSSCPFRKFILSSWIFKTGDTEQERFMEQVGGHVTSLILEECSFVGRDNFRRIIYQSFPKLQLLKMDTCKVNNDHWYETTGEIMVYNEPAFGAHGLKSLEISYCLPHSMMDLMSHFQKLKKLLLRTGPGGRVDYLNLMETLQVFSARARGKSPLEYPDVNYIFELGERTTTCIELLKLHRQLNLPLQRIEIWFYPDEDIDSDVINVIKDNLPYHSSALKSLEFHGNDRHGVCKPFPFGLHFENLERLVLPSRSADNLSFLLCTPILSSLEFGHAVDDNSLRLSESDNIFSNSSQLEIGDWTLPTLTNLSFPYPLSTCNLTKLMKWMPNVEQFELQLDNVSFSMVCNNWINLKNLVDLGDYLTDEGVIGTCNGDTYKVGDEHEETQSFPNITKLANLTSFRTSSSKLTSASLDGGFLKLANLEELTLGSNTEIDAEAVAALGKRKIRLFFCSSTSN